METTRRRPMRNAIQIVTDADRIRRVHAESAPRSPLPADELHPDATIDAKGRAHAPHDGYSTDGETAYRGGEYLPDDPEAGRCGTVWRIALYDAAKHTGFDPHLGAVFVIEGTPAQIRAVREEAKAQEKAFDAEAGAAFPDGARGDARLMLFSCWPKRDFETGAPDPYGRNDSVLRDANLRPVKYTGKQLAIVSRRVNGGYYDYPDIGRWIEVTGSFKHWKSASTGNLSVIMKRPSKVGRIEAAPGGGVRRMDDDSIGFASAVDIAADRELKALWESREAA